MSGPAPIAFASGHDSLRRMADLLRAWTGAPRLGLLLVAAAFMLFLVVGNSSTAHAAAPDAPTSVTVTQKNSDPSTTNFDVLTVSWTAPSGTLPDDGTDQRVDLPVPAGRTRCMS